MPTGVRNKPGYIAPYRLRQRPVTSLLTIEEHAKLRVLADEAGIAPTTYATRVLRNELEKEKVHERGG